MSNDIEHRLNGFGLPTDLLTTFTINTSRPQYYFDQEKTHDSAIEVHKKYRNDDEYSEYIRKALPIMLSDHIVLGAIYLFDKRENDITDILTHARPDHIPSFWLNILNYKEQLDLNHGLGSRGKKFVWKFLTQIAEERGPKTVALWFTKYRKQWQEIFFKTHPMFKQELKHIVDAIIYRRDIDLAHIADVPTREYLYDLAQFRRHRKADSISLEAIAESNLPFNVLEGYASQKIDTTTEKFYEAAFNKMTLREVLRRSDAMKRCGFLNTHRELWKEKMNRTANTVDPVEIASVMLQHTELEEDLRDPLERSIKRIRLQFPESSVVLCDASKSMGLVKTNATVRAVWELIALMAAKAGVDTFLIRDNITPVDVPSRITDVFGSNEAYNPTSLSIGLEHAKQYDPSWIFLITDGQSNLPYRGHERLVAEEMNTTNIVLLNPTINPLETEGITRIGSRNEVHLPLRGVQFFGSVLEMIENE